MNCMKLIFPSKSYIAIMKRFQIKFTCSWFTVSSNFSSTISLQPPWNFHYASSKFSIKYGQVYPTSLRLHLKSTGLRSENFRNFGSSFVPSFYFLHIVEKHVITNNKYLINFQIFHKYDFTARRLLTLSTLLLPLVIHYGLTSTFLWILYLWIEVEIL